MNQMPTNAFGVYTPPETRIFNGKGFSLAWYTGITSKYRAEQAKKAIKQFGSKPYLVRLAPADGAYYVYTRPTLTREDSRMVVNRLGGT